MEYFSSNITNLKNYLQIDSVGLAKELRIDVSTINNYETIPVKIYPRKFLQRLYEVYCIDSVCFCTLDITDFKPYIKLAKPKYIFNLDEFKYSITNNILTLEFRE